MNSKMKVWECNKCEREEPCRLIASEGCTDGICIAAEWHETTRYEITERKPDYQKMAENRQFGKDANGDYCFLMNYLPGERDCFYVYNETSEWGTSLFTPCAEPQELDPITMEPKK